MLELKFLFNFIYKWQKVGRRKEKEKRRENCLFLKDRRKISEDIPRLEKYQRYQVHTTLKQV